MSIRSDGKNLLFSPGAVLASGCKAQACLKAEILVISYSLHVFRYKSSGRIHAAERQQLRRDHSRYDILVKSIQFIDNEYKRSLVAS